ncbi:MAG: RNA pseudouridine synthase [Bacteroidetes bacterium]|nr:RNA pseudouridine synthase [Bacteroidota bacterium]
MINDFKDRILYEDNHIIIVNKLPSEIVQGDKTGDKPLSELLKDYVKVKYNKPGNVFMGVIHRIDRPVSGAVVFAKTSKALERFNKMLQDRTLKKKYWAVVKNPPPEESGNLIHYLKKNQSQNKSYVYNKEIEGAKKAELRYMVLDKSDGYYLLEVELITGRHHQIRAQLSAVGCCIKGDLKYGFARSNPDGSINLHAREVNFLHPIKNTEIKIIAPVPDDKLWKYFEKLQS